MINLKGKWYEEIKHLSEQSQQSLENNKLQDHQYFCDKYDQGRKMWLEFILLPYLPFLIERFTDKAYDPNLPISVNHKSIEYTSVVLSDGEYTIGYLTNDWHVIVENEQVLSWGRI